MKKVILFCLSLFLIGCGGGSGSNNNTVNYNDPDFSEVEGVDIFFSDDESIYTFAKPGGNTLPVYKNNGQGSELLHTFSFPNTSIILVGISGDGKYIYFQGSTEIVDTNKFELTKVINYAQPTISYLGNIETGEIIPLDTFDGSEIIAGRSHPLAFDIKRQEVYFGSRNTTQSDAEQPDNNPTTVYIYNIESKKITREIDFSPYCSSWGKGDYSTIRDSFLYPCNGGDVFEVDQNGNISSIYNNNGAVYSASYVKNDSMVIIQDGYSGYSLELSSLVVEQVTPSNCNICEFLGYSDDLSYLIIYTSEVLTNEDTDTSFDSYMLEKETGNLILLDNDLPEQSYSISKYLSQDATFYIGVKDRRTNPFFDQ